MKFACRALAYPSRASSRSRFGSNPKTKQSSGLAVTVESVVNRFWRKSVMGKKLLWSGSRVTAPAIQLICNTRKTAQATKAIQRLVGRALKHHASEVAN